MAPELLVLSASDVHAVLGYDECAEAMREALLALAAGRAQQPLRTVLRPAGAAGLVALMPSYLAGEPASPAAAYGLKAICITPSNPAAGLDTHQGVVLLSSGETGEPVALLNASAVTEIRTAAVSVVATELLARRTPTSWPSSVPGSRPGRTSWRSTAPGRSRRSGSPAAIRPRSRVRRQPGSARPGRRCGPARTARATRSPERASW